MKIVGSVGRSLHVLVLALCGLSFYALMLMLLFLLVGLIVSTGGHAEMLSVSPTRAGNRCAGVDYASCVKFCVATRPTLVTPRHRRTP